jgi:hypothetical protein
MPTVSCLHGEGYLGAVYDFFSRSKVGVTASLVAEAAALIIGILAITHVLPGVGTISGAVITGLGGFFSVLTIALVCSRCTKDKNKTFEGHSRNARQPITPQSTSNFSSASWKDKLEQLSIKNQEALPPTPDVPPQECLNTLCFFAQTGTSTQLFREPLPYVEPVNEKMKALVTKCRNQKGTALYLSIANTFLENLQALNTFVRDQTQAILLQKPTEEERKQFKLVNKQIRMILLYLMSHEPKKSEYLECYRKHVDHSFGNREWNTIDWQQPSYYFEKLKLIKEKKIEDFCKFIFLFSIYRRHYLLRLLPKKFDAHDKPLDQSLRTLLSATWYHGTRAVTTLKDTDFVLMPTGWLHQVGHISFFGEMSEGCQTHGVNANSLSGTYLDRVDWSVNSYASGFQFDINNEIKQIDLFLNIKIDTSEVNFHQNFVQYSISLPRIEVALKRWARWDAEAFKEKMPQSLSTLKHLKEVISIIEKKKPKEIFAWHDRYYSSKYESLCHSVNQIEGFLNAPLPPALTKEQKKNIKKNFPAVLGSITLLSEPTSYDDNSGEHLVRGAAQVGNDLQLLCVEKGNLRKAKKWVQAHLTDANIKIFSFEQLEEAQKINKIVSPFLTDIFSLKKFNKLCTV